MKKIMAHHRELSSILLLIAVMMLTTFTFAYFSGIANNDKKMTVTLKTGKVDLVFEDNDGTINEEMYYGKEVTKKFLIQNVNKTAAAVSMDFVNLVNTYSEDSLRYTILGSADEEGPYEVLQEERSIPRSETPITYTMAEEVPVDGSATYYFNLVIKYVDTGEDQTADIYPSAVAVAPQGVNYSYGTKSEIAFMANSENYRGAAFSTKFSIGQPMKYRYYTLTIDPNGGSTEQDRINPMMTQDKLAIERPTRVGYAFSGWALYGVGAVINGDEFTMGIGDATLIATWSPIEFNVYLEDVGDNYELMSPKILGYEQTLELPDPEKEGYKFITFNPTGGTYDRETKTFTLSYLGDVTLSAVWELSMSPYTVEHYKMDLEGNYPEEATDVDEKGPLNFGDQVEETDIEFKNYGSGFTPEAVTEMPYTIKETGNVIRYNYVRNRYKLEIDTGDDEDVTYSCNKETANIYYEGTANICNISKTGHTLQSWSMYVENQEGEYILQDERLASDVSSINMPGGNVKLVPN